MAGGRAGGYVGGEGLWGQYRLTGGFRVTADYKQNAGLGTGQMWLERQTSQCGQKCAG